jgi:hypothetical protein
MANKVDTKALRELAGFATPGPWRAWRCNGAGEGDACGVRAAIHDDGPGYIGVFYDGARDECHHVVSLDDAAFIAAAHPQTVIALLDEIDGLRAERDEALRQHEGRIRQAEKLERRLQVADAFEAKIKGGLKDAWKGERAKLRAAAVDYRAQRDLATEHLAALTAARDEACDIAYRAIEDNAAAMPTTASMRIDAIRKVGTQ